MSKKSRKKSPKTSLKQSPGAKSSKASKKRVAKVSPSLAKPSSKKGSVETLHKAASKRLKSSSSTTPPTSRNKSSPVEKTQVLAEGANKHRLAVSLISDETHQVMEAYGAWGEKSMYGRTFLGIIRTTVLIGPDGHVARLWRHVRVDGHADEVLKTAQAL